MKRVLIIGANGQDGVHLRRQLLGHECEIWSISRDKLWKEQAMESLDFSILDRTAVDHFFQTHPPDELYYLAAYHHSSQDRSLVGESELWANSMRVHVDGWRNCLEALSRHAPSCRAFYAASSHLFGKPLHSPQNEETPFQPESTYGLTKLYGVELARYFRRRGCFISVGILYNHESPQRAPQFVSQKIVKGLCEVVRGQSNQIELLNLSAQVDWGYVPDFVEAMRLILQHDKPDDYVVATGELHSVGEFAQQACAKLGLNFSLVVKESGGALPSSFSPAITLRGDNSKLRRATGWKPKINFSQMVDKLLSERI